MKFIFFSSSNISAADTVFKSEEDREAAESSPAAADPEASEQAAVISSEQGECLKTNQLRKTNWSSSH